MLFGRFCKATQIKLNTAIVLWCNATEMSPVTDDMHDDCKAVELPHAVITLVIDQKQSLELTVTPRIHECLAASTVQLSIPRSYSLLFLDEEVAAPMVTHLLAEIFWCIDHEFPLFMSGLSKVADLSSSQHNHRVQSVDQWVKRLAKNPDLSVNRSIYWK